MDKLTKIKLIVGSVLAVIAITVLSIALVHKYTPNDSMMALNEYYFVKDTEAMIILETAIYPENAILEDGGIYIPLSIVQSMFTEEFYYDEEEEVLSYALPTELIQIYPEDSAYYSNHIEQKLDSPAMKEIEERMYISMEFVGMFCDVAYEYHEDPNRLVIHYTWMDALYFDTLEETPLRFEPDIKSEILLRLPEKTKLFYVGGTGTGRKSFIRVMTADGIFGYVQRKFISDSYYYAMESSYQEPEFTYTTLGDKVRLGWHQVTVPEANGLLESVTKNASNMNVISPTWYRIIDEEGAITSLADAAYVEQAHQMGLQVWALVDNFDKQVDCLELLSSTKARATLIQNLIAEVETYGFDGLNMDFEALATQVGVHYVQFLKELSIQCRNKGIILSVDNYVPAAYNQFYDLTTQGKFIDYVIIMAYDEHYSGSPEAGSVSSIGFVTDAVNNTLDMMSKDRIVMGIPFYTRLWKETIEGGVLKLSSEALTMQQAENALLQNEVQSNWDSITAQYYAEYTRGETTYKIWLEEEGSLSEKLRVIAGADVAGVAAWRLGYETEEIWPLIETYIH